jgi:hypothetical protein
MPTEVVPREERQNLQRWQDAQIFGFSPYHRLETNE